LSIAFSPDGKYLASSNGEKTVKLWSFKLKKVVITLQGHSNTVNSVAFSPDSKYLISGSKDKIVKTWSVES
jgi:WD40 repeat protein